MHDADRYETISIQNGEKSRYQRKIYRPMCMRLPIIKTLAFSFSIIIRFFRHTSWSHETGITSKDLCFF